MSDAQDSHVVNVMPADWRFEAGPGEALVGAAARAGIRLPASCRNGTCRTCMCALVEGEVAYPGGRPGLTAEEMQEGWILPCVARARTDLRIEVPDAAPLEIAPPRPIMTGPRR
ncbi:2Fe-2S iron-sulfur cluster-binding protein [Bordetella bronchialis]|uniref:Ferredoxin n=1 Tax=Bordetella bronchialis TaxID=463025 RepID=A0A193FLB5_9BORD|nr:2Fe-2S iron-sulfur cluster-binding protein [Bordetella bronchialis]ANN68455.1 ferredoxin [Bordetella bronchialis]ANN73597.1 ferredoxin [Bordetella bronchialis]